MGSMKDIVKSLFLKELFQGMAVTGRYLFAPKITARTMDLHPAVAFGTVIAGASLFGPVGALVALPAAAVIQAIATTYLARHEVIDTQITEVIEPRRVRANRSDAAKG